jgi:hypothetical protein
MTLSPQTPPPKLASESVVIAAPMSFAGSTARVRNAVERVPASPVKFWAVVPTAVLFLLLAWAVILCWYVTFGLLLVPYRLLRRGQRKRELATLRHREFMMAMHSQQLPYAPPPGAPPQQQIPPGAPPQ